MIKYFSDGYFIKDYYDCVCLSTPFTEEKDGVIKDVICLDSDNVYGKFIDIKKKAVKCIATDFRFNHIVWERKELLNYIEKDVIRSLIKTNIESGSVKYITFWYYGKKKFAIIKFGEDTAIKSLAYANLFEDVETNKKYSMDELGL